MLTFSEKIKKLRTEHNLTQQEFADSIFVTRSAVSKWEQGRGTPGLETLKIITKKFGLTIDELVSDEELNSIQSSEEAITEEKEVEEQEMSDNESIENEEGQVNYSYRKIPWGLFSGICGVIALYLTVGVVAGFLVLDRIEQETNGHASLFGEWWQTLLFTLDIVFIIAFIGLIVLKVIDYQPSKEKKSFPKVAFNSSAWGIATTFFAIAFTGLMVGQPIVQENEGNINYAFGIDPYVKVTDEDPNKDTEYFKSKYYKEDGKTYDDKAMRKGSFDLTRELSGEGAVLLWNNNDALPLKENSKLSLFGVSTQAKNYRYTGTGSGQVSVTTTDFDDLKTTFESEGKYQVNPTLWKSYENKQYRKILGDPFGNDKHYREFQVNEKPWADVNTAAGNSFQTYGDAAIFIITRDGGEDADTWFDTSKNTNDKNIDNNYLDLTKNEVDTIEALMSLKEQKVFNNIVLVLNTGTPLNMKTISKYKIDACLWAGMGGNASFYAMYDVLSGKVNPSGRLPHTYVYDNDSAPAVANTGAFEYVTSGAGIPADNFESNSYNHQYIVYQEGIYVGYRYYETRYEDTVLGKGNATANVGVFNGNGSWQYQKEVKFPFGYGLSYTDFDFDSTYKKVSHGYEVKVGVTNTGTVAGKTPIQVYLQKPYTQYDIENNIEKASIELVAYDKTDIIEPGQRQEYTLFIDEYEFKSYDSYNKKTYILEKGNYYISVGENAHDALNNVLAKKQEEGVTMDARAIVGVDGNVTTGNKQLVQKVVIEEDDFIKYSVSPNGYPVTNQFDDADLNLYKGTKDQPIKYLSRNNWLETYPTEHFKLEARHRDFVADLQYYTGIEKDPNLPMPTYGTVTSDKGELKLIMLKGLEYNHPYWEDLLNQMTWEETIALCGIGNHAIQPVESIGAPPVVAHDGPAGVKTDTPKEVNTFHAFPAGVLFAASFNDELCERVCEQFGIEMLHAGVGELYGTGAGMHRSAYSGRNWEYFSEDGYLSGKILSAEVKGLQSRGAIVNIKHFVLNDQEIYRCGVSTWANEQSIREIYLKGFEAGVTEGHANGVMSSLNRIGATWAGRHYGLLTEVLRNEWGFEGLVETDSATGIYMRMGNARAEAVVAGNDLWLRGSNNATELWGDFKDHSVVAHALRKAAHNILYAVCNSSAMNGIDSSTRFEYVKPWYYNVLTGGQVTTGTIMSLCIAATAVGLILNRKKKSSDSEVDELDNGNITKTKVIIGRESKRKKKMLMVGGIMAALIVATSITVPVYSSLSKGHNELKPGGTSDTTQVIPCEHKCETCGGCLDMQNENPGCAEKCGDQHAYNVTFNVADLKVAKTGCVVDPSALIVKSFNKTNEGAISYQIHSDREATVSMVVVVKKTTEEGVFTDNVKVLLNNQEIKKPTKVPALKDTETEATAFVEVNLGCVPIIEGTNMVTFIANEDGAKSYDFKDLILLGNPVFTLEQATEVQHSCVSVCPTCKGCLNFSCYNPGCTNKCTCSSNGLPATIFWVCDERVETNRAVNAELDGIGCTWGKETLVTYKITASKTGKVTFGAVVSSDVGDVLFTDQFIVKVNGIQIPAGVGKMPVSAKREWNNYSMIVVGEITLYEGKNTISISQTPVKGENGGTNCAYNFQSMIIFGDGQYDWFSGSEEGDCQLCVDNHCTFCGGCKEPSCGHVDCLVKCECIVQEFESHDPRVIFDGKSKTVLDYCGGSNNDPHDIIYYIESDKATTVDLYSTNSAIAGGWEVAYNKTWNVFVNDVEYKTSTIHTNCTNLGISDSSLRFTAWHDEYVSAIPLKVGVNKIVFDATGSESLNFKGIKLVSKENINFSLANCGLCDACSTSACGSAGCTCEEGVYNVKAYDKAVTYTEGFKVSDKVAIGHNGYVVGATITLKVTASEATTTKLDLLMTGDKLGHKFNEYYSLSVNGVDTTTQADNVYGEKWKTIGSVSMDTINLKQGDNIITITYTQNAADNKWVCNFISFMFTNVSNGIITWQK